MFAKIKSRGLTYYAEKIRWNMCIKKLMHLQMESL